MPRTIRALLWPPGKLTSEWWNGRRSSYVNPLRLYLLMAIPFFIISATTQPGDDQESILELLVSLPTFDDSSEFLPPQGPLAPEQIADPLARAEWQQEFARIRSHNDSIAAVQSRRYTQGLARVFELLPLAVGVVMIPLLALLLRLRTEARFIARLILSLHIHTVAYGAILVGAVVGQGFLFGAVGSGLYLAGARRRLFDESWYESLAVSTFTLMAYGVAFLGFFLGMVSLLAALAPGWTYGGLG